MYGPGHVTTSTLRESGGNASPEGRQSIGKKQATLSLPKA